MEERQLAKSLDGIRTDHVARYRWAAEKVGARVLDCACGCGYGAEILSGVYLGLDISMEAISYARQHWKRAGAVFLVGDAMDPPGGFDTVVSFETLEHLRDPVAALMAFGDSAPHLLASVPNEDALPFDRRRFPFHEAHYRIDDVRTMLARAGWDLKGFWGQKDKFSGVGAFDRTCRTIVFEARLASLD